MASQSLAYQVYKVKDPATNQERELRVPYIRRPLITLVALATNDQQVTLFGGDVKTTAAKNWSMNGKNFFPNQSGQIIALGVTLLGASGVPWLPQATAGAAQTVADAVQQAINLSTIRIEKDSNLYREDPLTDFISDIPVVYRAASEAAYALHHPYSGSLSERSVRKYAAFPREPVIWGNMNTGLKIYLNLFAPLALALNTFTVRATMIINDFPGASPDLPS